MRIIKKKTLEIIFLCFLSASFGATVLGNERIEPLQTFDLNGLLFHGESSYKDFRQHSLQPYDPNYFIIELLYAPDKVNLWIRYYSLFDERLHPLALYRDGWGSGAYYIDRDAATYIDITYYDSQPDYGDVQYWGECWIPSG